jgi:hypothetical protein
VPRHAGASALYTLTRNGKSIIRRSYPQKVPAPDLYRTSLKSVPFPSPGTYRLTVRITVNGISDERSATLKVVRQGQRGAL